MALIGRGRGMARSIRARKNGEIVWIRVAGRAHAACVTVTDAPPRVAKSGSGPSRCGVARRAIGCENRRCRLVDGVRGGVVIRRVAAVTRGWQRCVVAVHMATGAGHFCVRARQRKRRGAVIELAICPNNRVVAQVTGSWETRLNVIHRSRGRVVVVEMTRHAGSIRARQSVVVVDMTVGTNAWGNGV